MDLGYEYDHSLNAGYTMDDSEGELSARYVRTCWVLHIDRVYVFVPPPLTIFGSLPWLAERDLLLVDCVRHADGAGSVIALDTASTPACSCVNVSQCSFP